jgi:aryl-alcohol dehydrogenase-like predicted oxidoreductase
MRVSVIALGCWGLISDWNWGEQDKSDSIATVQAALDAGINFFDTAEAYGDGASEELLAQALAGKRHDVIIASKAVPDHLSAAELRAACENSLRRLKTDYIDLYQIHWPNHDIPLAETMETLEGLQQEGKIRAAGVCNFGVKDLSDLLAIGRPTTNQLPYSLLWRAIEFELLPACLENDVGILAYSPLMQGLLTGKFSSAAEVPDGRARTRHFSKERPLARHSEPGCERETFAAIDEIRLISCEIDQPLAELALAWLLHQEGVTAVLVGARQPAQIRQNVQAAAVSLPAEIVTRLDEVTETVKQKLGPNLDLWQSDSRAR